MKLDDKIALTRFAMEFVGTYRNVRFPHRSYPIPRITSRRLGDDYELELETRKGNLIILLFDPQGRVVQRTIG